MKKLSAYTFAEVILAIVIIGVISVMMLRNMKTSGVDEKATVAKATKGFAAISQTLEQIRVSESDSCPAQTFITKVKNNGAYVYEYALLNSAGNAADTDWVYKMFDNHMNFDEIDLKFCDYTSSCSDNNIKGAKVSSDMFVGLEIYGNSALQTCPKKYYMPDGSIVDKTSVADDKVGKCWGNVYLYIKNKKNTSTEGKNFFKWGLGENGLAY